MNRIVAALAVFLVIAQVAVGATDASYPALRITPAQPDSQALSDMACQYLTSKKFDVGPCPTVWVSPDVPKLTAAELCPDKAPADCTASFYVAAIAGGSGTVLAEPWDGLSFGLDTPDETKIALHIHELLHRVMAAKHDGERNGYVALRSWKWTADDNYWEEGLVQAVTEDVTAGFWARHYPMFDPPRQGRPHAYLRETRHVRALTARWTRGSWRSRKARSLRSALLRAPVPVRRQAIETMRTGR